MSRHLWVRSAVHSRTQDAVSDLNLHANSASTIGVTHVVEETMKSNICHIVRTTALQGHRLGQRKQNRSSFREDNVTDPIPGIHID